MSDGKEKEKKPDLGLLEEDDEFEEFPAEGKSFRILSNSFLLEFFFHSIMSSSLYALYRIAIST